MTVKFVMILPYVDVGIGIDVDMSVRVAIGVRQM